LTMKRNKQKTNSYYHTLARNMLLTIIIAAVMPMVVVSSIALYQFDRSYQEKVYAHLEELVLKHKQNIDNFLKEKLGDIHLLATTFTLEELSNEDFLRDRLELLQQIFGPVFVDLGVVNARGIQVAYAGPFKLGKALYSTSDWFRETINSENYISDVFLGLRGLPHFVVAVRENYNGESWILRSTIDFVAFNDLVENIRIGETGFAYILNNEGKLQTKTLIKEIPPRGPCVDFVESGGKIEQKIEIMERIDEFGEKELYVTACLKDGKWLLIFRQRASDAFAELNRTFRIAIVFMLLGVLGIVATGYFLSRRMVSRIAKADQEKEMITEQVVETGKLASVGELAAGIAHEINNPVAIMVEEAGWIEDLLEEEEFKDGENLGEFRRALLQIRTQGGRCKEITHKLLSFARKTDSRIQDIQLNDVTEEMIALSAQRAKYSNVEIHSNFQENLPTVRISQSELQQVLLNLINNALDAMEKIGGNLRISTRMEENSIVKGDDHLLIEVVDDGPGIPAANLAKIFDPFFTTKPVGKGTGLGLSICYGIVKKMGGNIEARSIIDGGTTFTVKLPLPKPKKENA
jgi:two-component system, NtrC family, sensor kinase